MTCNTENLYLLSAKRDVAGQLAWLKDKLAEAQAGSMHVFIIGNISPGSKKCNK